MRFGAATGLRPLPGWKGQVDFLFVQIGFTLEPLLRWRDELDVSVPVYAGVMALNGPGMARSLAASIPDIDIPAELVERVGQDPDAGVDAACDLVLKIKDSGAFDGVHLVPVSRYRAVAARLEQQR
jgi:5,10-methylenetetrahydrofolate reductase